MTSPKAKPISSLSESSPVPQHILNKEKGKKKLKEKKVKTEKAKGKVGKSKPALVPLEDATLDENSLKDGLRVLSRIDGHFYPGRLNCIKPPDIYGILLDNERGFRPHIYAREELLKSTIKDIRIRAEKLPVGTRVCAYWSSKYQFMHPGTVVPHEPGSTKHHAKFVNIELDDGDSRELNLENVRLLPHNYPQVVYQEDTVQHSPGKRKSKPVSPSLSETVPKLVKKDDPRVESPHPVSKNEVDPDSTKMSSTQEKKLLEQEKAESRVKNIKPLIGKKIEVPSSGNLLYFIFLLYSSFKLQAGAVV